MAALPDPLAPYAPIRTVGVPHAPFDGVLARGPDGNTVLLVDRVALDGWGGWDAPGGEHVLAPLDVCRRADGHDVVLPAVSERLDRFLSRRGAHAPLTEGEAVTLAVSVLRGLADVVDTGFESAQWWLTDDGRPLLVPGVGDADPRRASAEILEQAASAEHSVGGVLRDLAATVLTTRRAASLAAEEDLLFSLASGEPLATDILSPARPVARRVPDQEAVVDEREPWWAGFAARFDGELSDTVSRLIARTRRRRAETGAKRRLPLLVGAAVAVTVLTGGLLWPDGGEADAGVGEPARTPSPVSTVAELPPPAPAGEVQAAPDAILAELLRALRGCTDDACRGAIWEDPSRAREQGAVSTPDPAITLIDDLGGLVVLRVASDDPAVAAQLVTIVDTPNGWRVRDVFDIADPPGADAG